MAQVIDSVHPYNKMENIQWDELIDESLTYGLSQNEQQWVQVLQQNMDQYIDT